MTVVCIDSNVLLHCAPLQNLAWGDLVEDSSILVVILPSVAREIDRHKVGNSDRVQKRARYASQLMRQLLAAPGAKISLRENNPTLEVELAIHAAPNWSILPSLNSDVADDWIIAELLSLDHEKANLLLLTNDTIAAIKARNLGLSVELIPEGWLLRPDLSESELEIRKLRNELRELSSTKPMISLWLEDKAGNRISGNLQFSTKSVPALSEEAVVRAMDAVEHAHPYAPRQYSGIKQQLLTPLSSTVRRTYDQMYEDFISGCNRIFTNLPHLVSTSQCVGEITLVVENVGKVPAEGLIIEFSIEPSRWYLGKKKLFSRTLDLPRCPASGEIDYDYSISSPYLPPLNNRFTRDSRGFYWDKSFSEGKFREAEVVCEDFRHGENARFSLVLELAKLDGIDGALKIRASAKNLAEPETLTLPLRVSIEEVPLVSAIDGGIIKGELATVLQQINTKL